MKPTFQIFPTFLVVTVALAVSVGVASGEDWPMYRHDQAHTGYTTSKVPMAPNLLWEFDGGGVVNSPAVVDGMVYFGSWAGAFYALDAENGVQIWKHEVDGDVHTSSPAVVGGKVYFGTEGGGVENGRIIYALNIENGDEVWSRKLDDEVNSSPVVVGGKVFVGSSDGKVHALDAANGNEIWSFQTGDTIYTASPTVVDNTVYIGSWDGKLYALNAADGNLKWSYSTGGTIDSTPAVVNGVVFIGSGQSQGETWAVHALDANTGQIIWKTLLDYPVRSSPAIAGSRLFIGGGSYSYAPENGEIYSISLETGSVIWSYQSQGDYVGHMGPVVSDNTVIASASRKLLALSSDNGAVIWQRSMAASLPVIADDKVYVGEAVTGGFSGGLYTYGTPPPRIESPVDNLKISGTAKFTGTALGDTVQAVQLNWGSGWVNAASLKLQTETAYNPWGVEYAMNTTRYVNNWSHDWNSRSVPNGTNTVRARILYTNGAYSDETTITLQVENFPLDEVQIAMLTAGIVALVVVVFWLRRR
ncbi:MAG: PQQ-binding-like beta-propeller repeat protein [Candidatus Hadarchaeota archaeon]